MPTTQISFARYFADLPDPRVDRTKRHRLDDILIITLCAVICGADSFEEIERFGTARQDWLKRFRTPDESEEEKQRRLHEAAMRCAGTIHGDDPHRAENARALVREKLARRYGR